MESVRDRVRVCVIDRKRECVIDGESGRVGEHRESGRDSKSERVGEIEK